MQAGYLISGIGHMAVILWVMVGGFLDTDRIPDVQTAEVSIITEEEFAALSAPQPAALRAPEPETPERVPTELDSLLLDASPAPEAMTPDDMKAFADLGVEQVIIAVMARDADQLRQRSEKVLALAA